MPSLLNVKVSNVIHCCTVCLVFIFHLCFELFFLCSPWSCNLFANVQLFLIPINHFKSETSPLSVFLQVRFSVQTQPQFCNITHTSTIGSISNCSITDISSLSQFSVRMENSLCRNHLPSAGKMKSRNSLGPVGWIFFFLFQCSIRLLFINKSQLIISWIKLVD